MPSFNLERRGAIRAGVVATLAVLASFAGRAFPKATAASTAAKSTSKATGKQIIKLTDMKVGKTYNFIHSSQGVPAILFRTKTGVFAYSAICTHQGCTVSYNSSSKHLKCPCHGAEFDPLKSGNPVSGPADSPLANVKVAVKGAWIVEA